MELNGVAAAFLVIGYLLLSAVTVGAFVGIAMALNKLNAKLEELTIKVEPLLAKADQILSVTNEKVAAIGDRAEGILAQGEGVAEDVHTKVDKTATAVQRTIHAPIINLNSLAAGVTRGVETFGRLQRVPTQADGSTIRSAAATSEDKASVPIGETTENNLSTSNAQAGGNGSPALSGKETLNGGY